MNTIVKSLDVNYLNIEKTSAIDLMLEEKFARLRQVCNYVLNCRVKVANIARHRKTSTNYSYLISISLNLPEGIDLYALRSPQPLAEDSIEKAIADAFAKIYRKLIELQFEENRVVYR